MFVVIVSHIDNEAIIIIFCLEKSGQSSKEQLFGVVNIIIVRENKKVELSMSGVVEITKEAIEKIWSTLEPYCKELDQSVPWKVCTESIKELAFHGEIVGELKNAQNSYYNGTQSVYEWCGLTSQLLVMYLQLLGKNDSKTYEAEKALLVKVLEDGKVKMEEVLNLISVVGDGVEELQHKLTIDSTSLDILKIPIINTKYEIREIRDHAEDNNLLYLDAPKNDGDDDVKAYVDDLIERCGAYLKRHGKQK